MKDGLDVFAMDSFRTRHVVPVLVSSFGRARHGSRKHLISVRDQRRIAIRCAEPMPAQADGEYLGEVSMADIESVDDALRVLA
jgi:diacylglycerol kinase family enzyme